MRTKPLYVHDCRRCEFIGSFVYDGVWVDAYKSCDASHYPYSVRYSSVGSDYVTIFDDKSPMFAQCAELEKDKHDILGNLRLMKADALREREEVLEQLGKLTMKLKSYSKEIEYWENQN